jgi:divalent metal cation (Fe/Co/Zn/Cd) transporter
MARLLDRREEAPVHGLGRESVEQPLEAICVVGFDGPDLHVLSNVAGPESDSLTGVTFATDPLRSALRWSVASVAWTVLACGVALGVGIAEGALSLVAFSLVGMLDAVGSVALVVHFRHALHHAAVSEARERVVLLIVAAGMALVALLTGGDAVARLSGGSDASTAVAAAVVALPSVFVLAVLGRGKIRIGRHIASPALVADGRVSAIGATFAAIAVIGTGADALAHAWWLDPTATLVIAAGAMALALRTAANRQRYRAE